MAALSNPKHERFALALAKGMGQAEAYADAGYKPSEPNASRLTRNDKVQARVSELQERAADKVVITVATITERLLAIATKAERKNEAPMLQVARASLMDAAKLNGLVIDKADNTNSAVLTVSYVTRPDANAPVPAWEGQLTVSTWDTDEKSEGYGQPTMFSFAESAVGQQKQPRTFEIHPDRVIVWSRDGTLNGRSALEPGYNALLDMEKIRGGGGEGFWKNAKSGLSLEIDKDAKIENMAQAMGVPVAEVVDKIDEQVEGFNKGFDKSLLLSGIKATPMQVMAGGAICLTDGGFVVFDAGEGDGPEAYVGHHPVYGSLDMVGSIKDGSEAQTTRIDIGILPVSDVAAAALAAPSTQGTRVQWWEGAVDPGSGLLIGAPELKFDGEIDKPRFQVGDSWLLTLECGTQAERQLEPNSDWRLNHATHQRIWPGEMGLAYVDGVARKNEWRSRPENPGLFKRLLNTFVPISNL